LVCKFSMGSVGVLITRRLTPRLVIKAPTEHLIPLKRTILFVLTKLTSFSYPKCLARDVYRLERAPFTQKSEQSEILSLFPIGDLV